MKNRFWVMGPILCCLSFAIQAQENLSYKDLDLSVNLQSSQHETTLAQLDTKNIRRADKATFADEKKPLLESRPFTLNKLHKYLGYASMISAGLTILSPKAADGPHETFGKAAAALGAAAVVSGFAFHYEDLNVGAGFKDPDNLHMLLGIIGTAGYAAAVSSGEDGGHGGPGAIGALSMAMAIKLTW